MVEDVTLACGLRHGREAFIYVIGVTAAVAAAAATRAAMMQFNNITGDRSFCAVLRRLWLVMRAKINDEGG